MSGGALIQWLALALCVIFALMRLPDALRGKGRIIFAVLVLLSLSVALSLTPIYLFIDGLLGGVNVANLVIRLSLYAIMMLLGIRCAAAFGSSSARRLLTGPVGVAVLAATVLATVVLFVVSDLPESSTGLNAYSDQATVRWYADVGRFYPAYVSLSLVAPAVACAHDRSTRSLHRVAAALMAAGFAMVVAITVLKLLPIDIGAADVILPFGAIMLVTSGLTMFWLSRRRAVRERSAGFTASEHGRF